MSYQPVHLSTAQVKQFQEDGFLIVENFISPEFAQQLAARMEPLFYGEFETGIYPDEWYWRPGLSLPDVTREMCNAWKCDRTIASLVLSSEIGRLTATLAGWEGARIGQDSLWMKPPGAKAIAMHQDGAYIDYLDPAQMMTCWVALDDAAAEDGTLGLCEGLSQMAAFLCRRRVSRTQERLSMGDASGRRKCRRRAARTGGG